MDITFLFSVAGLSHSYLPKLQSLAYGKNKLLFLPFNNLFLSGKGEINTHLLNQGIFQEVNEHILESSKSSKCFQRSAVSIYREQHMIYRHFAAMSWVQRPTCATVRGDKEGT